MNEPEWERHQPPDPMAEADAMLVYGLIMLAIVAALALGFGAGFGARWWFWR